MDASENTLPAEEARTIEIPIDMVKQARMKQWQLQVRAVLENLLKQANEIQIKIEQSQTAVKREYYKKKMKKISDEVMQVLAILRRFGEMLETPHEHEAENNTNETTPATIATTDAV